MYADAASHRLSIGIVQYAAEVNERTSSCVVIRGHGRLCTKDKTAVAHQEATVKHMNWFLADRCPDRGDQQLIATGAIDDSGRGGTC